MLAQEVLGARAEFPKGHGSLAKKLVFRTDHLPQEETEVQN